MRCSQLAGRNAESALPPPLPKWLTRRFQQHLFTTYCWSRLVIRTAYCLEGRKTKKEATEQRMLMCWGADDFDFSSRWIVWPCPTECLLLVDTQSTTAYPGCRMRGCVSLFQFTCKQPLCRKDRIFCTCRNAEDTAPLLFCAQTRPTHIMRTRRSTTTKTTMRARRQRLKVMC